MVVLFAPPPEVETKSGPQAALQATFAAMLLALHDRPAAEPWASAPFDDDRDWEFHTALDDDPADLIATYVETCERSRAHTAAALAAGGLDTLAARPRSSGARVSLRWILLHMIEETARHNGHADLLREAADGSTGE